MATVDKYGLYDMSALKVAANTADAYSADCFGPVEWVKAAEMLLEYGLTEEQAEAVLRSKLTRWCRDSFGEHQFYVAELYRQVATMTTEEIDNLIC